MTELNTYHEHSEEPKLPNSLRVNPFAVPEDYFPQAISLLQSFAHIDVSPDTKKGPFIVPEGYFETANAQLKSQLFTIPFSGNREQGMSIPAGYFEDLSDRIRTRVAVEELKDVVQEDGFSVPSGYFEESAGQLRSQVRFGIHKDGFDVEPAYFEKLSARIYHRIDEIDKADNNVISFPKPEDKKPNRKNGSYTGRWNRMLAAASVAVILSFGVYFGLNSNMTDNQPMIASANEVSLEDISDEELMSYLAMDHDHDDLTYFVEYIYEEDSDIYQDAVDYIDDGDLEEYIKLMLE